MPGLQIIITKAGRAALVNAEHNGTAPLKISAIGITAAVFTANEDTTTLPGEIKRLTTISGEVVAADTIHVTIRDDGIDTYAVRGIGYWLNNGVLFGVYSQPDPILQKSTQSMMLLAADAVFTTVKATALTFGDANFTNPPATVDRQGVVELATPAETVAGTDGTRAVTPAGLSPAMAQAIAKHLAVVDPHQQYLTPERGNALYFRKLPAYTDSDTNCDTLLDTGVRDVSVANDRGVIAATRLPMGADGYGTLTTENGGQFVHQVYTEASIRHRTWQRSGYLGAEQPFKGSDWKQLWDSVTFDPASKQDKLPFTPVQQGTGHGQKWNVVKIGWTGDVLKVTVDDYDLGAVVFQANLDAALKNYLPLSGGRLSGKLTVVGSVGSIATTGAETPAMEVSSDDAVTSDAYMTFRRAGRFAAHFGLDANNDFAAGGYSMGNVSYKFWHAGNFNPAAKQDTLGYRPPQAVGTWLNSVTVADNRATSPAPQDRDMGIYFDFKNNDAGGLNDGGVQHGEITFRQWGAGGDFSGGPTHQLGFTANGNLHHRTGSADKWAGWQRFLTQGQNGTLPDNGMVIIKDCNSAPLGWATYTQEATANRPSAYGQLFTSSLTGNSLGTNGNWLMQRALSTDNQIYTRVNTGGGVWTAWALCWSNNNFDPGSKATGNGYVMNWAGQGGQPTWLLGGNYPNAINVYNPANFSVNYANSAGTASSAGNADRVGGVPMRWAENNGVQPYYLYGVVAGNQELTLFTRTQVAVGSCVSAMYANQLSGQGLGRGGIGNYELIKNKSTSGLPGAWEQRGQVYDYGSGASEGNESSAVLWQRECERSGTTSIMVAYAAALLLACLVTPSGCELHTPARQTRGPSPSPNGSAFNAAWHHSNCRLLWVILRLYLNRRSRSRDSRSPSIIWIG
ncbi:hypothetical protein [Collimonas sp.]|jgi:hypothetical protein|uniref:hypothetical protein n=1 Tax=Collimonas sp. TaxID=1963772 RepID=UPI002CBA0086|nr:hypothetical protein [Collimonas sp.]HWX02497.1 hypothetical protein [Collimonas sp.]